MPAAVMRSGQPQTMAQQIEERGVRIGIDCLLD
jgi:hypothetical protein